MYSSQQWAAVPMHDASMHTQAVGPGALGATLVARHNVLGGLHSIRPRGRMCWCAGPQGSAPGALQGAAPALAVCRSESEHRLPGVGRSVAVIGNVASKALA
eukprot:2384123-Lingulodinium_polyedra.AAC.1